MKLARHWEDVLDEIEADLQNGEDYRSLVPKFLYLKEMIVHWGSNKVEEGYDSCWESYSLGQRALNDD